MDNENNQNIIGKVLILGDQSVGKTSLRSQYMMQVFSSAYRATVGGDFMTKQVHLQTGEDIKLQIWDTAGQERFNAMSNAFYRGGDVGIFVYDVCNLESFNRLKKILDNFIKYSHVINPGIILVGNKIDKTQALDKFHTSSTIEPKQVNSHYAIKEFGNYMNDNSTDFFETSAKNNIGIDAVFIRAAEMVRDRARIGIANTTRVVDFDLINNETNNTTGGGGAWRCC